MSVDIPTPETVWDLRSHGKCQVETEGHMCVCIYIYLTGIYAFNRGQGHLILLVCETNYIYEVTYKGLVVY